MSIRSLVILNIIIHLLLFLLCCKVGETELVQRSRNTGKFKMIIVTESCSSSLDTS